MNRSCILAGVGGQGIVLASKLIAAAAMDRGEFVRTAETIGMSQRGGSVVSHVRMGEAVYSPQIPKGTADLLIGFEPGEAVRCLPYLKPGGIAVVADKPVIPVTISLGNTSYDAEEMLAFLRDAGLRLTVVDTEDVYRTAGSRQPLNVALLGAAAALGALDFSPRELEAVIKKQLPAKFQSTNQKALWAGVNAAEKKTDPGIKEGGMDRCR